MEQIQATLKTKIIEFIFRQVALREGPRWLGAARDRRASKGSTSPTIMMTLSAWGLPLDEKTRHRLKGISSMTELLEAHLLKSVRLDSHMGLLGLVTGAYALRLRTDIPSPAEMLDAQCLGERYVTYLSRPEELNRPVGRFTGAFDFLMHDLEHAHKLFGDKNMFLGQVSFFNLLRGILPCLEEWREDPLFNKDLSYLMSDMNSHPVHLFKYLKAIVLTAELRRGKGGLSQLEAMWRNVLDVWRMPAEARKAALRINHPGLETNDDQVLIQDFFVSGPRLC